MPKKKCSSGDTRSIHPYIKDYIEQFKTPIEQHYARTGWTGWANVKKKKYEIKGETHWQVVSFDIVTKQV